MGVELIPQGHPDDHVGHGPGRVVGRGLDHPHRSLGASARITVEVEGVTYEGEVRLVPASSSGRERGKIGLGSGRRSAEIAVVQPELAVCRWCEHFNYGRCQVTGKHSALDNVDGSCAHFTPSIHTRLARALRLGRAPLPRSSEKKP